MQERSMEVGLNDELDKNCKAALGEYCSENIDEGVEFLCLQENYELIKKEEKHYQCIESLEKLTSIASEELDLEQVLFQACEPMVQKFCSEGKLYVIIKDNISGNILKLR